MITLLILATKQSTFGAQYKSGDRVPWNDAYMDYRNEQFIMKEAYRHGKMDKLEREVYRNWLIYRRSLTRGSAKSKYRAWRWYRRKLDKILQRHGIYPKVKKQKKLTPKEEYDLIRLD